MHFRSCQQLQGGGNGEKLLKGHRVSFEMMKRF